MASDDGNKKLHTNVRESLGKIDSGPSGKEGKGRREQVPVDMVEEESMESFPASDAPGHLGGRTGKGEPHRPTDEDVGGGESRG